MATRLQLCSCSGGTAAGSLPAQTLRALPCSSSAARTAAARPRLPHNNKPSQPGRMDARSSSETETKADERAPSPVDACQRRLRFNRLAPVARVSQRPAGFPSLD
ncbi:hypothetical protein PHYSODRAFT_339438 [Phytophthora sojae]|uniref:Uncharacterized protein n=1 Tax=Phytophthora sojae (strain P6497) TaxID=1094619 RepID=G5A6V4_PHYSP|nr:hypothetical protein PHYSODRAFT_339438 [Phytophthora sojae]EGZ09059.1 hypothetical protein PHYSODRAFT_339438 [Phytophthora sojae]|eukprot:XP_009535692.1 hypothetical protein PHYSODRAFT_339438 [Phytophthora sojae]